MSKKSTRIALGGLFSALCLVLMFLTGLIPFSTYTIPILAGAMLIPVMAEIGASTAWLVYAAVALLSIFIAPDKEAVIIFIAFFGYYPIVKDKFERLRPRLAGIAAKLLLFNAAIALGYLSALYVFGMPNLLDDAGDFGRYGTLVMLGAGNVVFMLYDFLITRYTVLYIKWFKPTFLKR